MQVSNSNSDDENEQGGNSVESKSENDSESGVHSKQKQGKETIVSNIIACRSISHSVKVLLGPLSMEKMIFFEPKRGSMTLTNDDFIITNDGFTVLSCIDVDHPAAKLLIQLSRGMDLEYGDGTTSVTILAGAMLGKALSLLESGVDPMTIIRAFTKGLKIAEKIVTEHSIKFNPYSEDGFNFLHLAAKTSLSSKMVSKTSPWLSEIVVKSVLQHNTMMNEPHVICVEGGLMRDSHLVSGFLLCGNFLNQSKGSHSNIALIQFPLTKPKPKNGMDYQMVIDNAADIDRILREEESYIKNMVVSLKKLGVDIVGVQNDIVYNPLPPTALSLLTRAKIAVLPLLERNDLNLLRFLTGAKIFTAPEMLAKENAKEYLGKLGGSIQLYPIGSQSYLFFPSSKFCTIVLRGGSNSILAEMKRSFHDAVCVVKKLLEFPFVSIGGGACEVAVEVGISRVFQQENDLKLRIPLSVYGTSFLEIPETLAQNAGVNPLSLIPQLRKYHIDFESEREAKEGTHDFCKIGINVFQKNLQDMCVCGVYEPLKSKLGQFSMATETAISILKIDQICYIDE